MRRGKSSASTTFSLRTATEAEMAAAYEAQRQQLPPRDIAPRAGDGENLALSVAKWEGRAGIPGKPFVIWAIGSSWTRAQGDGYGLIHAIRQRFPHAPPIIYKRHVEPGMPWDYAYGWVKQFVAAEQPDLIFTYTLGTPEGLDAMLTEIRRHTTADIIVPSIHFVQASTLTPDDVENGIADWDQVREVCRKHGAEFVDNRRELAEYLQRTGVKPTDLLGRPRCTRTCRADAGVGQRQPAHRPARAIHLRTRIARAADRRGPARRRPPRSRSASPATGSRPAAACTRPRPAPG